MSLVRIRYQAQGSENLGQLSRVSGSLAGKMVTSPDSTYSFLYPVDKAETFVFVRNSGLG